MRCPALVRPGGIGNSAHRRNRLHSGLRVEVTNVGPGDAFDVRLSAASSVGWSHTIWESPRVAPSEKFTSNDAIDVTLQRMIESDGAWIELSWRQLPNTKRLRRMRIHLPPDEAPLASLNNRVPPRPAVKRKGRLD